ncbi:MAG: Glycolate dehydrogenase, iron-sulfur subunit GlcF [uncultured Truepera sp.]|uniref:Glycolate oxidase iron-sulfur subunit n=1 Tax=uncultured Truepera sp. TaxID=543023 RepID=A0A6J4VCV7_9DEIN|nr:MAG: Glycolate dehydrogenase, iron-sulfur subunit GlcF [uncultured Truepera sp.]
MRHKIPLETPLSEPMADAVESCVHCGFCLPTCPTYVVSGEEMHSPRGRIVLMKGVLEGELALADATEYIDACLGCLACVTACPSGVEYGELITSFRMEMETRRERPVAERALRCLITETLPYPARFRAAAQAGGVAKPLRGLLPGPLGDMLGMLPERVPKAEALPETFPAEGTRRAKVALLAGCAQRVLDPDINWATLRVLAHNGVEVVIPKSQSCCGALSAHTGVKAQAQAFARNNVAAFPDDVDAVLTNAAGCGSGLHEYPLWLRGEPEEEAARAFSSKAKDISVFLTELGVAPPPPLQETVRVAYHDACHLAHAQRVMSEPRMLLKQIPGVELLEPQEAELCCGSAGTYNLEHPEMARELGLRKARSLLDTGAQMIVSGNIGCMTQISAQLKKLGQPLPVLHTVQLLDRAYKGFEN